MYVVLDASEHNAAMTAAFKGEAIILRAGFGDYWQDKNFLDNTGQVAVDWSRGELPGGAVLYLPFISPGTAKSHDAYLWDKLIGPRVPDWLTGIMVDEERWPGAPYAQSGDHSSQLNQFYGMQAHRFGSWRSCKGYFNLGDGAALWPHRDPRCEYILADYTDKIVVGNYPGCVGQQYTDGSMNNPVPRVKGRLLPRADAPFGACDHSVFPTVNNAAQFRALWGRPAYGQPAKPAKPPVAPPRQPPPVPAHGPYDQRRGYTLVAPGGHVRLRLDAAANVHVERDGQLVHTLTKGN
jgi:hypothetical protein